MCTVLHAIVAAALPLLAGSSAPAAWKETGPRRGPLLAWLWSCGGRMGSADRRGALPDAVFWIDLLWSAAIGLVLAALAPALPNQFAQTAPSGPTTSMARSATLKRRPASSIMYIFPYAIVTVALSHLAGSSPPARAPVHEWASWRAGTSGDRAGLGKSRNRGT
jgi:hypothetical protein